MQFPLTFEQRQQATNVELTHYSSEQYTKLDPQLDRKSFTITNENGTTMSPSWQIAWLFDACLNTMNYDLW